MPKSGRERRARRRAIQAAEHRAEARLTSEHGDHWDGGLADQQLLANAIRERWGTSATASQLTDVLSNPKTATIKQLAVAIIHKGLLSEKGSTAQAAVRNLIAMEAQNQKDEHHAEPQEHEHKHLHIHDGSESRLDAILERLRLTEAVEQAEQGGPAEDDSVAQTSDGYAGRIEGETETGGGDKGATD